MPLQGKVDIVAFLGVIQIAIRSFEVPSNKVFGETFLKNIEAQLAAIQFNQGVGNARNRHLSGAEQFTSKLLFEVRSIFDRVVQMNLLQTAKPLAAIESLEIQSETRFVVDAPKTPGRTFQMNTDVTKEFPPSAHIRGNVLPTLNTQAVKIPRSQLDLNPPNGRSTEKAGSSRSLVRRRGAHRGGK